MFLSSLVCEPGVWEQSLGVMQGLLWPPRPSRTVPAL